MNDNLRQADKDPDAPTRLTKIITDYVSHCQPSPFSDPLIMTAILSSLNRSTGHLIGAKLSTSKLTHEIVGTSIDKLATKCAEGIRLHARRVANIPPTDIPLNVDFNAAAVRAAAKIIGIQFPTIPFDILLSVAQAALIAACTTPEIYND